MVRPGTFSRPDTVIQPDDVFHQEHDAVGTRLATLHEPSRCWPWRATERARSAQTTMSGPPQPHRMRSTLHNATIVPPGLGFRGLGGTAVLARASASSDIRPATRFPCISPPMYDFATDATAAAAMASAVSLRRTEAFAPFADRCGRLHIPPRQQHAIQSRAQMTTENRHG